MVQPTMKKLTKLTVLRKKPTMVIRKIIRVIKLTKIMVTMKEAIVCTVPIEKIMVLTDNIMIRMEDIMMFMEDIIMIMDNIRSR